MNSLEVIWKRRDTRFHKSNYYLRKRINRLRGVIPASENRAMQQRNPERKELKGKEPTTATYAS